ncbi:hypothetical protein ACROYT_G024008 [Oculina patagonica]
MPESKRHTGPAHEQLLNMLRAVHSESKSLEEKVGECPVFKTKKGCPFKDASKEGKPLSHQLLFWRVGLLQMPASSERSVRVVAHLPRLIMKLMPSSDKDCHHKEALLKTMKVMHSVGHEKADECPVLQKKGCPFKAVESEGKPLISPPEAVLPAGQEKRAEPSIQLSKELKKGTKKIACLAKYT